MLGKTADGSQQMTIRLHPAELGMVQVRIERASSGMTQVEITAEKADTLQALQRDQSQLHRTLDEAGLPAAGRTVTFHVAQPAQAPSGNNGSGQGGGQAGTGHAWAGRTTSGNPDAGGSAGGGKGGYPAKESSFHASGRRSGVSAGPQGEHPTTTTAKLYRIGLDITA
ncbi:MAG: flagellar hook-length control protein FliK [Rhodopila sp.]|nr:flagellar hook-length control protein FliK [Rhodopila sp.]